MTPFFTLYTPTFNRALLLPRVFDSLLAQSEHDFEWIVIDDGSTDDTAGRVAAWAASAPFPVRYVHQANQGKHIATNRAVDLARGELFVIVDSDDWLADGGLAAMREAWTSIPAGERPHFAGVGGYFLGNDGQPVTRRFPADPLDCRSTEVEYRHGIVGEIALAVRTDLRRHFPFPEDVGPYCMPSVVWNRIAVDYRVRYVDRAFQHKEYQPAGLTLGGPHRKLARAPEAFRLRSRELLNLPLDLPLRVRRQAMRTWVRASFHAGRSPLGQWRETDHPLAWLVALPKGWRDYRKDLRRLAGGGA